MLRKRSMSASRVPTHSAGQPLTPEQTGASLVHRQAPRQVVAHLKVIMSVRLSVVAFGFKGSFAKFALPEFKTL